MKIYNLARVSTATTSTGTITLGSAVSGYLTFALAGVVDGDIVSYGIKDGANSETGTGTYTASGTTLTRNVTKSTNSNNAISLSGSAEVFTTIRAEDIVSTPTPKGRVTLTTATPVLIATVSGATTVYYTPYVGNVIPIYDGSSFLSTAFAELSQATTDATKSPAAVAASKVYDLFVWNDAGTLRCTRGPAWTNSTTRGYTLTMTNGILLNTSTITNGPAALRGTWVGTVASNGSSTIDYIFGASASGGTAAVLNVWNTYNRVLTPTTVTDSGVSYTYASGTIRQARASAGNQIAFVIGAQEESVQFSYSADFSTGATLNNAASCGVGFNSTTVYSSTPMGIQTVASVAQEQAFSSAGVWAAPIGTNIISANEASVIGTSTFNAAGYSVKNMLMATIRN